MHTIKLKHYSHDIHIPDHHELSIRFRQIMNSERFWAIVSIIVLIGVFIMLAVMASKGWFYSPPIPEDTPYYPYYPYNPA